VLIVRETLQNPANKMIARVIIEELAQDFVTKGSLSDWFSRDESAPPRLPLRKKPNPRNVANAAKAEELEKELAR
jgi:kinetochore protein Mis13/DSN1